MSNNDRFRYLLKNIKNVWEISAQLQIVFNLMVF